MESVDHESVIPDNLYNNVELIEVVEDDAEASDDEISIEFVQSNIQNRKFGRDEHGQYKNHMTYV